MISSPWRALGELFFREKTSLEANHHVCCYACRVAPSEDGLIGIAEVVPRPARMLVRHLPWIFSACSPFCSQWCGLFAFFAPRMLFFFLRAQRDPARLWCTNTRKWPRRDSNGLLAKPLCIPQHPFGSTSEIDKKMCCAGREPAKNHA